MSLVASKGWVHIFNQCRHISTFNTQPWRRGGCREETSETLGNTAALIWGWGETQGSLVTGTARTPGAAIGKEAGGAGGWWGAGCKSGAAGLPGSMSTRLLTRPPERPQMRGRLRLCPHSLMEPLNPASLKPRDLSVSPSIHSLQLP